MSRESIERRIEELKAAMESEVDMYVHACYERELISLQHELDEAL